MLQCCLQDLLTAKKGIQGFRDLEEEMVLATSYFAKMKYLNVRTYAKEFPSTGMGLISGRTRGKMADVPFFLFTFEVLNSSFQYESTVEIPQVVIAMLVANTIVVYVGTIKPRRTTVLN